MEVFGNVEVGLIGEAEITICELVEATENGVDLSNVDGIIYKKDGEYVRTAQAKSINDLDALQYPDYDGFEFDLVLGKQPTDENMLFKGNYACVSFGRSCPYTCTFCFHPSGVKYRKRSIDSVFKEIDWLLEKYDIKNLNITDELFSHDMEYVKEFCKGIKERNLGFRVSLRADFISEELVRLLKDSGCVTAVLGLESADNTILKSMRKNITIEQTEAALKILHDVGLNTQGFFIFGDLEETMETAMNTINWWKNHP